MSFQANRFYLHLSVRDSHLLIRFQNDPVRFLIPEKMELYYDVKIVVKDTSLFKDTYTGKFRQRDSLDDVFRVLQQIRKFKVNTKKLRLVFALTSAAVVGSFCRFCFSTVLSS